MISTKDLTPEELSWFLKESEKYSEDHEELIWIYYEAECSKGHMVINPKNINKLRKTDINKLYKLLQTTGHLVEHGNGGLNIKFFTTLMDLTKAKGRRSQCQKL